MSVSLFFAYAHPATLSPPFSPLECTAFINTFSTCRPVMGHVHGFLCGILGGKPFGTFVLSLLTAVGSVGNRKQMQTRNSCDGSVSCRGSELLPRTRTPLRRWHVLECAVLCCARCRREPIKLFEWRMQTCDTWHTQAPHCFVFQMGCWISHHADLSTHCPAEQSPVSTALFTLSGH